MDPAATLPAGQTASRGVSFNRLKSTAEALLIPIGALAASMVAFGVFVLLIGKDPLEVYALIWKGGFASSFAWQNTLQRAAPLVLTALCVAIPAQAGLVVIGGEGGPGAGRAGRRGGRACARRRQEVRFETNRYI